MTSRIMPFGDAALLVQLDADGTVAAARQAQVLANGIRELRHDVGDLTGVGKVLGAPVPGAATVLVPYDPLATDIASVTPDGMPIVLLVDHQPTGGYPVIAVAIRADLPRLGQVRPGTELRFQATDQSAARAALRSAGAAFNAAAAGLRHDARWDDLWRDAAG